MAAAGHGVIWRRLRWLDGCDGCDGCDDCDLITPNDSTRCVIPRDAMRCCRVKEQKEGGKRRVGASKTGIPWPARKGSRAQYQELPLPPRVPMLMTVLSPSCFTPHASRLRLTLHASRFTIPGFRSFLHGTFLCFVFVFRVLTNN
jgi:hypothetical protein